MSLLMDWKQLMDWAGVGQVLKERIGCGCSGGMRYQVFTSSSSLPPFFCVSLSFGLPSFPFLLLFRKMRLNNILFNYTGYFYLSTKLL